jgi:hypothetical protein
MCCEVCPSSNALGLNDERLGPRGCNNIPAYLLCMKEMPRLFGKATARAPVIKTSRNISIAPWFLFLFHISYLEVISESATAPLPPIPAGWFPRRSGRSPLCAGIPPNFERLTNGMCGEDALQFLRKVPKRSSRRLAGPVVLPCHCWRVGKCTY